MNDVASASTEPPPFTSDDPIAGMEALIATTTDAVNVAQRLAAQNLLLQEQNARLRVVAGAATALCTALDGVILSQVPGQRLAVADVIAARLVLVEKLALVSR